MLPVSIPRQNVKQLQQENKQPFLKQMALKKDQLYPGQCVSMDHFKVNDHRRLYTSRGKTHPNMMYSGGCIFVDHSTGFVHMIHMINFTAMETIQAK